MAAASSNIFLKFFASLRDGVSGAFNKLVHGVSSGSRDAERSVGGIGRAMTVLQTKAKTSWANIKAAWDLGLGAIRSIAGQIAGLIKRAFDSEAALTNFKTMLGSLDAAKRHVAELKKFAAATPLTFGDLSQASKTLLAFGANVDSVMPALKLLGDISLGNAEKFQSLSLAFAKVQSEGRLTGVTLKQMVIAGFNPLQEIARTTGATMDELKDLMEKGALSFDLVKAAMESATGEGGRFHDAMLSASKTGAGLFSTMEDNWNAALTRLGEAFLGVTKDAMEKCIATLQRLMKDGSIDAWALKVKNACSAVVDAFKPVGKALSWVIEKSAAAYRAVRDTGEVVGNGLGAFAGTYFSGGSLEEARRAGGAAMDEVESEQRARRLEAIAEEYRIRRKASEELAGVEKETAKRNIKEVLDEARASMQKDGGVSEKEIQSALAKAQRIAEKAVRDAQREAAARRKEEARQRIEAAKDEAEAAKEMEREIAAQRKAVHDKQIAALDAEIAEAEKSVMRQGRGVGHEQARPGNRIRHDWSFDENGQLDNFRDRERALREDARERRIRESRAARRNAMDEKRAADIQAKLDKGSRVGKADQEFLKRWNDWQKERNDAAALRKQRDDAEKARDKAMKDSAKHLASIDKELKDFIKANEVR